MKKAVAIVLFVLFSFVTVFGLPILLSYAEHHHDCPLAQGVQLCKSTVVEHMSAWELLLASILDVLVAVFGVFVLVVVRAAPLSMRLRYRWNTILRPTLFQELFSRGILNRKEPYLCVVC